ncbi:MAG: hypothetical protein AAGI68_05725 [Planctomycetota bacterium]
MEPTHGQTDAAQAIGEAVAAYVEFRVGLMSAGGSGLLVLADVAPDDERGVIRPVLLVRVEPDADADAVLGAIGGLLDAVTMSTDTPTLRRVAPHWMVVQGVAQLGHAKTDGEAEHRDAIMDVLQSHDACALQLAVRMTPALRAQLRQASGLQDEEEDLGPILIDPLVAVVRDAARTLQPLEAVTLGAQITASPVVEARLWFSTEEQAETFRTASDGFLNLLQQLMGGNESNDPIESNDPRGEVERLITAVRLTRTGRRLDAELGQKELAAVVKLGPSLAMMLLMGNTER